MVTVNSWRCTAQVIANSIASANYRGVRNAMSLPLASVPRRYVALVILSQHVLSSASIGLVTLLRVLVIHDA